jgi:hypothetical protein
LLVAASSPFSKALPRPVAIAVIVGISAGLLLSGLALEPQTGRSAASFVVEPAGQSWLLTPPSTWCNVTQLPDGIEYSCSMAGAAGMILNVSHPSRISGIIEVSGPASLWILPSVWACELEVELTHLAHSCPPPFDPPPWPTWNESFTAAGPINLSALPFNFAVAPGVLPPAYWALILVDGQSTNETATVTSSVVLEDV